MFGIVNMSSTMSALYRQFAKPQGLLGWLAGWIMATRSSNRDRNRWTVELLELAPTDRVLEIGHGPGWSIALAANKVPQGKIVGIDYSAVMHAQACARNSASIRDGRVDLRLGGLELLPTLDETFDKVFAVNVFGFLPDWPSALDSIKRVMKPHGLFAVTYMPRHANATPQDADKFAGTLAKAMTDAGFQAIRVARLDRKPMPAVCVLGRA
jgi:ubiquinone/menaquinone biosynthesis C-methylase UbiE